MKEEYRRLLSTADEPNCYEFPSGFDYKSLEEAAMLVRRAIAGELGERTKFEGAEYNQDASFSITINFEDRQKSIDGAVLQPQIRFSNFGRLVTVTWPELLGGALTDGVVRIMEARGFHYVPADILDARYDGVMAGNPNLPTWWIRYFDWI